METISVEARRRVTAQPLDLEADLAKARLLATLLDSQFSLLGIKFGLDALVGLIPVLGDTITTLAGIYPIHLARKHGLGKWVERKMMLNLAIDYLRKRRLVSLDEPDDSGATGSDRLSASGLDVLEQILEYERGAILAAAIAELPVIHREVLTLRFEEDMKLDEIAEVAGIPLSTVKSRLLRALESLRGSLQFRP